jgi:hypothetical protein
LWYFLLFALGKFLGNYKKKRPTVAQQQWWFHWDNAPVHTAAIMKKWKAA